MRFILIPCLFVLCACSTGIDPYQFADRKTESGTITLCHSYGCTHRQDITLTKSERKKIARNFRYISKTPEAERKKIGKAIAILEKFVTKQSGLPADKAEASSRPENTGQMDCIDETVNNHQFLVYLENEGFLKHHVVGEPIHRGYFIDGKWPHNTPTILQQSTGIIYAVDGFYREAGQPPYFIEKHIWMKNWRPEKP